MHLRHGQKTSEDSLRGRSSKLAVDVGFDIEAELAPLPVRAQRGAQCILWNTSASLFVARQARVRMRSVWMRSKKRLLEGERATSDVPPHTNLHGHCE